MSEKPKPYVLFFNTRDESEWHAWNGTDEGVDQFIVGELEGGWITEGSIDTTVRVISRHADLESAVRAFVALYVDKPKDQP